MANSNIELMKKCKSNEIKKLGYNDIISLYKKYNLDIEQDIIRLKKFINSGTILLIPESEVSYDHIEEIKDLDENFSGSNIYIYLSFIIPGIFLYSYLYINIC